MNKKTRKIVLLSILLSLAVILGYVESLIPSIGIPGVKIGLANIIILICVLNFRWYEALVVLLLRIILVSLILGTFLNVGFFMSLSGGLLSFMVMIILAKIKIKFSIIFISISGAIAHSIGQIIVAILASNMVEVVYYLPFILLLSIPTGIITGIIASRINKMKIWVNENEEN